MIKLFRFKIPSRGFSSVALRKDLWTKEGVVKSPCRDIVIPKTTVPEYIWRNLDKWPTKTATVCGITNRSYKYEELYKHTRVFAANLRKKMNLQNGDTVAVMMRNAPEYPTVVLGILSAGGVATTFNPVYTAHEVHRLILLSEAKVIVAHLDIVPTMQEALKLCKKDVPIIVIDIDDKLPEGTVSYKELVDDEHVDLDILKEVTRESNDVSLLPYSSGTTGLPKGVELTHYSIVANCEQQCSELRQYSNTTATNQDTALAILPLFHSYGQGVLMLHKLSVGLQLVTLPKFNPDTFINALLKYQCNLMYLAPPMVLFLGTHPEVTPKHLEHLTTVICGAAPLPPADIQKFLDKAPKDVMFGQGYGMTEASPLVSVCAKGETNYDAVGYALPNIELRIVNENIQNLGPNEVGELLIRGPNIMKGYKNNPKANSEVFLDDGWFRSGDSAKIDQQGLITISDRLKELIKVNGFQVPPAELEYVIKDHPDVFDAAIVGVPDPSSGERPKAFIVLKEGANVDSQAILDFVNERVAPYKRIKDITLLESIPKNPSGKILRKVLKDQYLEKLLFLGTHPEVTPKHLEHLTTVICGAAPLPPADIQKFLDKAPKDVMFGQGYGMTEASPLVSVCAKGETNYDAVGYALPNIELRIVNENIQNLGPNEVGELLIRGPNIMKGYKNNPKANSEVFLDDGWFRSGDSAKIDQQGLITISDRLKELIKVNGFQVPPAELEYVIKDHPDVFDAAIVGVPDPSSGERPKAFIVLKEGANVDSQAILDFVNERVAPYKRIKDITLLESIPKNPSGKILRKVLKDQYLEK